MRTVMVRYKVKPGMAAENERLIGEVFAQLARERPAGLRYRSVKLEDGVSFVHMASIEDGPVHPLTSLDAFQRFVAGIAERCEEPPVNTPVQVIGSYGD